MGKFKYCKALTGHTLTFLATTLQMRQCFRDSYHTAPYRHSPASGNQSGFGALLGIYQVWDVGQTPLTYWRLSSSRNYTDRGDGLTECGVTCAKNMACNKCSVNSRISTSATPPGPEFLFMGHPSGPHSHFLGVYFSNILMVCFLSSFRPLFKCHQERWPQASHQIGQSVLYPPILICVFFLVFSWRRTLLYNYLVIHVSVFPKGILPSWRLENRAGTEDLVNEWTNEWIAASCVCIAFQHLQSTWSWEYIIIYMLSMKTRGLVWLRLHR